MGRAKGNLIEGLAMLPWPAGIAFGVGGFFTVRVLLPIIVKGNPFAPVVAAFYMPASWLLLVVGLIGAAASWLRQLDVRQGAESIAALGWRHFEQLVGEALPAKDMPWKKPASAAKTGHRLVLCKKRLPRALAMQAMATKAGGREGCTRNGWVPLRRI
jgi:hypothetical protein